MHVPAPLFRRSRPTRRALTGVACAALVATTGFLMPAAQAEPTPSLATVEKRVTALRDQAEVASERYNDTRVELKSVQVRLKAAQQRLDRQRTEVRAAKVQLGLLAAETYKKGDLSTLDLILSDDPQDALAKAGYLPSLTQRSAGATLRLSEGEKELATTQAEIKAQEKKISRSNVLLKLNRDSVSQKLAQAQSQLDQLKASQRARLQASYSTAAAVPAGTSCDDFLDVAKGRARAAIAFACDQLGDPYVWAAAGPSSWDCSGLTMKAWQAAGVSLPHSSRLQAGYGSSVGVSDLQPGDLIFFHSPISHVAIYVGGGMMIHAPHSGDVVRIAAVYQTPSAAVRLA